MRRGAALNAADLTPNPWGHQFKPLLYLTLPLSLAVAGAYLFFVFYPVNNTINAMKRTVVALEDAQKGIKGFGQQGHFWFAPKEIIDPLEKKRRETYLDYAPLSIMLADLESQAWAKDNTYREFARQHHLPDDKVDTSKDHGTKAISYAILAQQIDPEGREGYEEEYQLRVRFAGSREDGLTRLQPNSLPGVFGLGVRFWQIKTNETDPDYQRYQKERKEQYQLAANVLKLYLPRDPTDSRLHYQLAEALYQAGEPDEAKPEAEKALKLAELNKHPMRTLTKVQKKQLREYLGLEGNN